MTFKYRDLAHHEKLELQNAEWRGEDIEVFVTGLKPPEWRKKLSGGFEDKNVYRVNPVQEYEPKMYLISDTKDYLFGEMAYIEQQQFRKAKQMPNKYVIEARRVNNRPWVPLVRPEFLDDVYYRVRKIVLEEPKEEPIFTVDDDGKFNFKDLSKIFVPLGFLDDETLERVRALVNSNMQNVEYYNGNEWAIQYEGILWKQYVYRLRSIQHMTIEWSAFKPEFKWAFTEYSGVSYVMNKEPKIIENHVEPAPLTVMIKLDHMTVYKPGNVRGPSSLITRPEGV